MVRAGRAECLVYIARPCAWRQLRLRRARSKPAERGEVDAQAQRPGEWPRNKERLVVAPLGQSFLREWNGRNDRGQKPKGKRREFTLHDGGECRSQGRSEGRLSAEFECAHDPVKRRGVGAEGQGTRERWRSDLAALATRARVLDGALQAAADRLPDGGKTRIAPARPAFAPGEGQGAGSAGAWQERVGGL